MSRNVEELLSHGIKTTTERLNDPKNVSKGDWVNNLDSAYDYIVKEIKELHEEMEKDKRDYERIREEIGDCMAFLCMGAKICDEVIAMKKAMNMEKGK